MAYLEAKAEQDRLIAAVRDAEMAFSAYKKDSMGLISDEDRKTAKYIRDDILYKREFAKLRTYNKWYAKEYKKEIRNDRKNRYPRR